MIIIHAVNGLQILPRALGSALDLALRSFPVVVVTGSRQTGKSTLVRAVDERPYLTLDNLEVLERARQQPDALVRNADRLILDEVQRSPDLLLAVKTAVDERRVPGRFLLTGSANLLLMQKISESLAGRALYLTLWPLTRREQLGLGQTGAWSRLFDAPDKDWKDLLLREEAPAEDWRQLALRGGYPGPALELPDAETRLLWFDGYTRTYLERDLQDLSTVTSLVDFRRLMRAACLRLGGLINQTELGRDVGLPQPTVHRHLSLLETSYQLVRVPPFSVNRTQRLIKAPKLYWCDSGLALHLAGESEPRGAHLENLVLSDLLAWRDTQVPRPEILHWRTTAGKEVDFVIEWRGRLLPVEVKASDKPRLTDARALTLFRSEYPDLARTGLLLHTGPEIEWIADGVLAAPWWRVI
ncbi:MAG TPA: ATP-binding protein [Thermoanaerobaculia bacterium]|nr:ATP-binding protein [Thermoanaerobaculia bacterium]